MDTWSAWLQIRISKLKRQHPSVFNDLDVTKHCPLFTTNMLLFLHSPPQSSYVVRSCISNLRTMVYILWTFSKKYTTIINVHRLPMRSYHIYVNDTRYDRSLLYWIPILHKCPYKERYNIETAKCSTNPIFRHIKSNNYGTAKVKIVKNERDHVCRMITWVVFLRMFWNFISSLTVKREEGPFHFWSEQSVMFNNITNHNNKVHSSVSISNGQQYYQPQQ
jgi:hypothetical protein